MPSGSRPSRVTFAERASGAVDWLAHFGGIVPRSPWSPLVLVLALSACGEEAVQLSVEPLVVSSTPPTLSLDLEMDATWVTPGTIQGWAFDPEQAASTLPLELFSFPDETLWRGNPDGDGRFEWQGELSVGEHTVALSSTDREGNFVFDEARITVRTNEVPQCRIRAPRQGARVLVSTDLQFEGEGSDADRDPLEFVWRSSLDGELSRDARFELRLVRRGVHHISLEVSDGFGPPCVDEVSLIAE